MRRMLTALGLAGALALACSYTIPITKVRGRITTDAGTQDFEVVITSVEPVDGGVAAPDTGPRDAGVVPDAGPPPDAGTGLTQRVTTPAELGAAMANKAVSTIVLAKGTFALGAPVTTSRPGPVAILGEPGAVVETNGAEEAFLIEHPFYTFRGFRVNVTGAGAYHAFKFNGARAKGLSAGSDALVEDVVMAVSPQGESGIKGSSTGIAPYPDRVVLRRVEVYFVSPSTNSQVEGIDGMGVEFWRIEESKVHHVQKTNGLGWGVLIKGGSRGTVIERTLFYDNDVHISVGGTSSSNRNPPAEHLDGIVRNNLFLRSKDVAIYLERAANTTITNNTITDSFGTCTSCSSIDVRYPESVAILTNNIQDKKSLPRDGGTFTATANVIGGFTAADFINAAAFDLRPKPGTALASAAIDKGIPTDGLTYDGVTRPIGAPDIGAYESTSSEPKPPTLALTELTGHGIPGVYRGGLALADFDRDGLLDVVAIGYWDKGVTKNASGSDDCRYGATDGIKARVYRNTTAKGGPPRFALLRDYPNLGGCGAEVQVGDFNGDANPDFVVQVRNGIDNTVYFGDGSGNFTPKVIEPGFACASTSLGLAVADFDRDGKDDIITNSDGYRGTAAALWYRWAGTAFEGKQRGYPHRMAYGGTTVAGDLDGDGYPDLIVGGNNARGLTFGTYDCNSDPDLKYGQAHRNNAGALNTNAWFVVANYALEAFGRSSASTPVNPRRLELTGCRGGDNLQYALADVDLDKRLDLLVAGSSGFSGRPSMPGNAHYAFAILRNVTGTATDWVTWENVGIGPDGGPGDLGGNQTNTGVGNLDYGGAIAVGDLNGDRYPEVVIQGHRRYLEKTPGSYVFGVMAFLSRGGTDFEWIPTAMPSSFVPIAECGIRIGDLNGDGRADVILCGAELPWHSNGTNANDLNTAATIKMRIFTAQL